MYAAAKSLQLCPTLCDPIDSSPQGSAVPGILKSRTLGWVAICFSQCMKVKSESEVSQSCLTLWDPMDCSLSGPSVHGIFQARVLEWLPLPSPEKGALERKEASKVLALNLIINRYTLWARMRNTRLLLIY